MIKLEIDKYYPKFEPNIYNKDNEIPYDFLLNAYNGKFVINNTKDYINNIKKYILIEYDNIILNIYYHYNNDINKNNLIKIIKRCYVLIKIYKITKKINIHILMSSAKRFFPKNMTINCNNINGGFTNIVQMIFLY